MKCNKLVLVLLIVLWQNFSFAQTSPLFETANYEQVMQKAKLLKKPVFYFIYAAWCPHCKKMKEEVLSQPQVIEMLQKNFVCAQQDLEKEGGDFFKEKYQINAFPTQLFLSYDQEVLLANKSALGLSAFLQDIQTALNPNKQLPFLRNQFLKNPSSAMDCYALLVALKKGNDRGMLNPFAEKYFETQSDSDFVSEINWRIFSYGIANPESKMVRKMLNQKASFQKITSPERVQKKLDNLVNEWLQDDLDRVDSVSYNRKRLQILALNEKSADSIVKQMDFTMAERCKNWGKYQELTIQNIDYLANNPALAKQIASVFLENTTNPKYLKTAFDVAKKLSERYVLYENYVLTAKIALQLNQKSQAKIFAKKAKDLNASYGFGTQEADEILNKCLMK